MKREDTKPIKNFIRKLQDKKERNLQAQIRAGFIRDKYHGSRIGHYYPIYEYDDEI
jgi:hypothetical protein